PADHLLRVELVRRRAEGSDADDRGSPGRHGLPALQGRGPGVDRGDSLPGPLVRDAGPGPAPFDDSAERTGRLSSLGLTPSGAMGRLRPVRRSRRERGPKADLAALPRHDRMTAT